MVRLAISIPIFPSLIATRNWLLLSHNAGEVLRAFVTMWILLSNPPCDRPRAWLARSVAAFFPGPAAEMCARADHGTVDAPEPVINHPGGIEPQVKPLQGPL